MNINLKELSAPSSPKEDTFNQWKIDLTRKPKTYVPLIRINGEVLFSRCSISAISGKAKSRKSTLMILLGAKYLTTSEAGKVLVIDTEMAEYYVHRNLVRLHKLVGWPENENNERMTMLQFREMSTDKRFEMFTRAIETFKPDLVFIDGVRDLIVNFNDIDATVTLIDEIMRLSNVYQCHICSIIHENKNDNTLRGHLGTELQNKSETVIAVRQTEGSMSIAMPAMTRNFPFDKFEFGFNSEGLPYFRDYAIAEHPNLNQSVAVSVTDHTISKREREEEETKTEETNLFANINGEQQQLPF